MNFCHHTDAARVWQGRVENARGRRKAIQPDTAFFSSAVRFQPASVAA